MERPLTTHRHFCTYFDHRYLAQGLALHASLSEVCDSFTLWVLALSEEAARMLEAAKLDHLRVVPLAALEAFDPELHASRVNRSLVEYYFTCSPCLPRYLLRQHSDVREITYLDSDLYFFSSPEAVFAEIGGASVAITPHRFTPVSARTHARYGLHNVGWLTFRDDPDGRACLEWWRERCIEWCFDRVEADRYADQKYLDRFQALFRNVHAIAHPGANLAPWNLANHTVEWKDGAVHVDGRALVFFHFQGLRRLSDGWYDSNLTGYGARLTPAVRDHVFRPYLQALAKTETFAATLGSGTVNDRIRRRARGLTGLRYAAGRGWRALRAALAGNLVRS